MSYQSYIQSVVTWPQRSPTTKRLKEWILWLLGINIFLYLKILTFEVNISFQSSAYDFSSSACVSSHFFAQRDRFCDARLFIHVLIYKQIHQSRETCIVVNQVTSGTFYLMFWGWTQVCATVMKICLCSSTCLVLALAVLAQGKAKGSCKVFGCRLSLFANKMQRQVL